MDGARSECGAGADHGHLKSMKSSLAKRLAKLEAVTHEQQVKSADLSGLSLEELRILGNVLDYTLAHEAAGPTGKRPLVAGPSGLCADDMVIYRRTTERAECRSPYPIR
jgi:hypothetical protein